MLIGNIKYVTLAKAVVFIASMWDSKFVPYLLFTKVDLLHFVLYHILKEKKLLHSV